MFIEKEPATRASAFLSKVREKQDSEVLRSLQCRQYTNEKDEAKFLVLLK